MAEPARRPVPGAWLRAVARKMKAWAESVLSEEESDFAAALAQARVPASLPSTDGARPASTSAMVTAPPVGLGPPEHWLRDVQGRRTQGPPADWVARVRKVAPHLVEGLVEEQEAPLPVSEAHHSFRARVLRASATDKDPPASARPAPVRDASRPAVLPEPSSLRASPRAPVEPKAPVSMWREVSGQGPVSTHREEPSRASQVRPLAPTHPFASPPATPAPLVPGRLSHEGPATPVPSPMMGGQPFANPVVVASSPASPGEVCVPPLGEEDRERSLSASGFPQGISASQALRREGASAVPSPPPRASPRSTSMPWLPRRERAEAQEREAEAERREVSHAPTPPFGPRAWTEAEASSTSRFATPVAEAPRGASVEVAPPQHPSWPELPSALSPDSPDVTEELRLWTRLRRLEREQRGE